MSKQKNLIEASQNVTFDTNGKVGIGATPAEDLHVEGTNPKIRLLNNTVGASGLEWWNDYGGTDHVNTSINWNEGSANWEFKSYRSDSQSNYPYGNIQFYNGNNSTPTLKMNINTAGHVTMPYQPAFIASNISGGTVNTNATVIYTGTSVNRGTMYNTTNGRMTAPVAGLYFITAHLRIHTTAPSAQYHRIQVHKNGSALQYTRGRLEARSSGNYSYCEISALLNLAQNDYIHLEFESNGGNSNISGNDESAFMGYLLG